MQQEYAEYTYVLHLKFVTLAAGTLVGVDGQVVDDTSGHVRDDGERPETVSADSKPDDGK